jgi:hypothetical protein
MLGRELPRRIMRSGDLCKESESGSRADKRKKNRAEGEKIGPAKFFLEL